MKLIEAIKQNNQAEVFRLLNLKTNPSGKKFINEIDAEWGGGVLYWVAYYGYIHFIGPLVKAEADVNKPDEYGATPVYIAAQNGDASAITALHAIGANVNTPNNNGETPVFVAAQNGYASAIAALHEAKAKMDTPNNNGKTPVFVAAQNGDIDVIKALKIAGAYLNREAIALLTPVDTDMDTSDNIPEPEEEEQTTISLSSPVVNDINYPCLSRESFVLGGVVDVPRRVAKEPGLDGIKSIKKGFQNPHVKQKKSSDLIHYQGLQSSKSRPKINSTYQYEDNDIQAILMVRLKQLRAQNPELIKPVEILAAVDNIAGTQLEDRLKQEQKANNYRGAYILLIPCNLGNAHWVGILLELRIDRTISRAEYVDSNDPYPTVPSIFQEQLQNVYPNAPLIKVRTSLQQTDSSSCGAYTIENLLMSALGIQSPENCESIRRLHLEALKTYNLDFYLKFYERQKNNQPTTASIYEQLGYLDKLKHIRFSKPELNRILEIKKCLSKLPTETQTALLQALEYNPTYKDNHSLHLKVIRVALQEALKFESKTLVELMELLFEMPSQAVGILRSLDNLKFRVGYEEILAITQCHLEPQKITNLQQTLTEQIKKDEEYVRNLQAKLWSDTAAFNVDEKEVVKFLTFVAEGEQDKAEEMLSGNETKKVKGNPDLVLLSGTVTDLSGRTFTGITAFQYAVWALDWHMWTMLRKYMPFASAAKQAQSMETGIWVKEHGLSASWQNLIDAIQKYINLCNGASLKKATTQWKTQVGMAQRLLPAHVVNEYCRPERPFEPCPDFTIPCLPRTRTTNQGEWFTAPCENKGLGTTFAYLRYKYELASPLDLSVRAVNRAIFDCTACQTLLTTRVQQREQLFIELIVRPPLITFTNIRYEPIIDIILGYLGMNTVFQKQRQSSGDSNHSPSTMSATLEK
jgi:hypothetical protein